MFAANLFSDDVTIESFDREYKKFQNVIMKQILQRNDIVMLRHVLEKGICGLSFNSDALSNIRSIKAFETLSEFGYNFEHVCDNAWFIREIYNNQYRYALDELLELMQYIFSTFELYLSRKFDMHSYKFITNCELGNDYRELRSFTRLFLKYHAGREIRTGRVVDWTNVKSCLFKSDDGEYEYYNLRYKETNKRGKNGREYKLSKGLSYSFSICAIVMFGAKIKIEKNVMCKRLHQFLVGGITT